MTGAVAECDGCHAALYQYRGRAVLRREVRRGGELGCKVRLVALRTLCYIETSRNIRLF